MALRTYLYSQASLTGGVHFSFKSEEGLKLCSARLSPITEGVDSFFNDLSLVPFTLEVKDPDGEVLFSLHKKRSLPSSRYNYSIIYSGGRVQVKEGRSFDLPNLAIHFRDRVVEIKGRIMDLDFCLIRGDKTLAKILGKREDQGKVYRIDILEEVLPLELYLASALILDNLYHDY